MRIASLLAFKGGAGKSTICLNVMAALAGRYTMALVDLDPQGNASSALQDWVVTEGDHTVATALDEASKSARFTLKPSAFSEVRFADGSGFYLLATPDADALAETTEKLVVRADRNSAGALKRALSGVRGLDGVMIDTAPSMSRLTTNAVVASNAVFSVYVETLWSLEGAVAAAAYVRDLREFGETKAKFAGSILNKARTRPTATEREIADLAKQQKLKTLDARIPDRAALKEGEFTGLPVVVTSPRSKTAQAFEELSQEVWRKVKS